VLLLGSSALALHVGMPESLAGRFILHRMLHWSLPDMSAAFGYSADEWIYFGGYPGASRLVGDEALWRSYVRDALVEPTISRDVLQLAPVRKPALLRHLFHLACSYPAQILSYNKMLGQLTDAGNTTTLAHYLSLLQSGFLISGLEPFRTSGHQKRAGSPKLIVRNSALVSASGDLSFREARANAELWGRLVENAVGAHITNSYESRAEIFYWRDRDREVDFIVNTGAETSAVEVKSGRMKTAGGLRSFLDRMPEAKPVIVGGSGIPLEEFLRTEIR
jgi:uncharacterized protein